MSSSRWGAGFIASAMLLAVVLAVPAFFQAGSTSNTPSVNDESRQAIIDALTVSTISADAECETDEYGLVKFQVGALQPVPDPRLWSDALSTPNTGENAEEARDELQKAICEDPLEGTSFLTFFATDVRQLLMETEGVDILDLNPWLQPYATETSEINVTAAAFMPLLDVTDPSDMQVDEAMAQNRAWQQEAAYVNTLLDRFEATGIEARKSIVNYHLAIGGLVVGSLPAVERNDIQEDLDSLVFSLTEKDVCEELLVIGANMGDKRPELFEAKECESPAPPPSTSPGPTPSPSCPPDKPNGEYPVCKDGPSAIPTTPPGGGGPAPEQSDPVGPPAGGEPPVVYTPPPTPAPTGPPAGSTPDPAPAPTLQPSAPPTNNPTAPGEGSSCAPGNTVGC